MSRHMVEERAFRELTLDREDRVCPECGAQMHIRNRRVRSILTLDGLLHLNLGLVQCHDEQCQHRKLYRPEQEYGLTATVGNRLGCPLLDRSAAVLAALVGASDSQ